ncbi:MAG: alpha/beta hydrolase [Acidobacteriota bacterium]|nr:alpha/beta hydrolase [Acidobacteriota bacterium]
MSRNETPHPISLHKEIYGSGDPILCLHGLGANLYTWRHFITPFSLNNKLILVDLKGFGASPKPFDTNYSIEDHADEIYRIIVEDNLTRLTVIGNSLGGGVALLLAIRLCQEDRARLSKLVLIASGGYEEYLPRYLMLLRSVLGVLIVYLSPSKRAAKFVLRACFYDRKKITREQVLNYSVPISSPGGRHALLQTAKQCIPPNIAEILAKLKTISVPTLILSGREDRVVPVKVAELLHEAIPNSTLELIEQCGHVPQEERPDETIAIISRFLAAVN